MTLKGQKLNYFYSSISSSTVQLATTYKDGHRVTITTQALANGNKSPIYNYIP